MNYKLSCTKTNERHTTFTIFDRERTPVNCGTITVLTDDLTFFLQRCWKGDIFWNDLLSPDMAEKLIAKIEERTHVVH